MTTSQLILMTSLYLAAFVGVLLNPSEGAPNRGSPVRRCRFRSGRAAGCCTARDPGLVASAEGWLLALPVAVMGRHRGLVHARLSDYLEGSPPLRRTRAGSARGGSSSNRPAARLPGRRNVPIVISYMAAQSRPTGCIAFDNQAHGTTVLHGTGGLDVAICFASASERGFYVRNQDRWEDNPPGGLREELKKFTAKQIAAELHARISSIRHPVTGEFQKPDLRALTSWAATEPHDP
jgi:hypothetical protein